MAFSEYADFDGLGLADLVTRKKITPRELVCEAVARAERLNPKLNAVVFADYERAIATAQDKLPKGPFRGVPLFLKDIGGVAKGMPTRQASRFIPPFPSDYDSVLTARFKAAGLVPLGKTNVPEFGLVPVTESELYGPVHNPWNPAHSTGGSSGGSAAVVAAGIVPVAHANDAGGSIRIPASCCGLVGLKPTRARITHAPDAGEAVDGLGNDLVVTRSVRDTAAILDAVQGNIAGDPYWSPPAADSYLEAIRRKPRRLRVAFSTRRLDGGPLHADCVAAIKSAAKLCADLGHVVEEDAPAFDQSALIPAFMGLWSGGLAAGIDLVAGLTGAKPSSGHFEGLTWGLYEMGRRLSVSDYLNGKAALQNAGRIAAKFHETHDVWLTSTLGAPPVKLGTFDMRQTDPAKAFAPIIDYVPFTAMQNATGQPAISLPLHWSKQGLPVGVHFAGRYGDELTLLKLAAQLERAAPWAHRYKQLKV